MPMGNDVRPIADERHGRQRYCDRQRGAFRQPSPKHVYVGCLQPGRLAMLNKLSKCLGPSATRSTSCELATSHGDWQMIDVEHNVGPWGAEVASTCKATEGNCGNGRSGSHAG